MRRVPKDYADQCGPARRVGNQGIFPIVSSLASIVGFSRRLTSTGTFALGKSPGDRIHCRSSGVKGSKICKDSVVMSRSPDHIGRNF